MNWFKKLIGGADEQEAPRVLDHPKDLQTGDIIKFGFCGLDDLSNASATVKEINTYDLSAGQRKTVFTLDAAGPLYFMAVNNERGIETIEVSRLILPPVVEQLFGFDQLLGGVLVHIFRRHITKLIFTKVISEKNHCHHLKIIAQHLITIF